jgi:hypothetical protein
MSKFNPTLFTIAKICYPSTDEWIKCTIEYYSALNYDEILSFAAKQMKLEGIILVK